MTQRERKMVLVLVPLGVFVLLFGGFITVQRLLAELNDKDEEIAALERDVKEQKTRVAVLEAARVKVERWRVISLPPDTDVAKSRYETFLQDLFYRNRMRVTRAIQSTGGASAVGASRAGVGFTSLSFGAGAEGTYSQLIAFLSEFYSTNLPHAIRNITITNKAGADPDKPLDINLKVEALSLPLAATRDSLVPVPDPRILSLEAAAAMQQGPTGLALAAWLVSPAGLSGGKKLQAAAVTDASARRDYKRLVTKNVFTGIKPPPPATPVAGKPGPEVLKYVQLSSITIEDPRAEASLRNRLRNERIRLRNEAPYNTFEVKDREGAVILKGRVKSIERRSVELVVAGKEYQLGIGSSLYEAIRPDKMSKDELNRFTQSPPAAERR